MFSISNKVMLCFLLLIGTTANAQLYDSAFDATLKLAFSTSDPGYVVLVAKEGKVIYKAAFGMANFELNVPMKIDSKFRIGSITKQFTASIILKLAEQGKLSLKDCISKYIKDFPNGSITIEQLLTHTSGLSLSRGYWNPELRKRDFTPEELINLFKKEPAEFEAGTQMQYNNNGYVLLGYIIEKVTGKPYAAYLEEEIFAPLKMMNSCYDQPYKLISNRVQGYRKINQTSYENAYFLSMTQPYSAGAILSTVDDLYTWILALETNRFISAKSFKAATTPFHLANGKSTGYGYGWYINNIQGVPSIKHDGLINGFTSFITYLPTEKVCVILLGNCENFNPENLCSKLAAIVINKPYPSKEISIPVAKLQQYQAVYRSKDGSERKIELIDGALYSYFSGGSKEKLYAAEETTFFSKNSLEIFHFIKSNKNGIAYLETSGTGETQHWMPTEIAFKFMVEQPVNPAILDKYTGDYIFNSKFILHIIRDGTQLYGLGEGNQQIRQLILPFEKDKFYAKYLDAQLWFDTDSTGTVKGLTKVQNGNEYAVKR
ncbi:serine hydrolase [Chitinophaga silvatica]|uniref:Serine hydrolase n=1 Tax=Chitinophaga silvatica TaxID=2282649 RepID=A0A3E1YF31_9BACT|nr:serine hydrolase [Chitinophaga silvatica]RFS25089.1 serine hydrolase [Chitinophaga silvatica]